jgi:two-component system, response regulator PdtaR
MIAPIIEPAAHRVTILVVEDDVQLRYVVCDTLRHAGFKVIETTSADEAAAFLRAPNDVSLVFSDIHLPGDLNGLGFATTLKREHPQVKIILTTGHVARDSVPADILLIPKPYVFGRVIAEIRRILGLEPQQS